MLCPFDRGRVRPKRFMCGGDTARVTWVPYVSFTQRMIAMHGDADRSLRFCTESKALADPGAGPASVPFIRYPLIYTHIKNRTAVWKRAAPDNPGAALANIISLL